VIWRTGSTTGVGSLPGEDPFLAAQQVFEQVSIPYLPELPNRNHYSDLAGRGAALLADLHVDVQPTGWRLVPRSSREGERARDQLKADVDALELAAHGQHPTHLKLQAPGPWTLSTVLELHRGSKALSDHMAVQDLAQSLAQGLKDHLADVQARFPDTVLVLQLDEPSLVGVLNAQIPTASGFGTLRKPSQQTAREHLRTVLGVTEHTVVHCCAPRPPVQLLVDAGTGALSLDAAMLDPRDDDALGQALEKDIGLLLGVQGPVGKVVETVGRMRDRVGVRDVTLTPPCGLAASDHPDRVFEVLAKAADRL
jgi:hypothetical protein